MARECERCGGHDKYRDDRSVERIADFTDYCAVCGTNLCKKCMASGCCGNVPAKSGEQADNPDDYEFESDDE